MSKRVLKIVSDAMQALGIEYGLGTYAGTPIVYPYFVGEYTETEPMTEDGLQESTFLLTGFSRDSWLTLEDAKERIQDYFDKVSGKVVMADDGSAVAVFYAYALIVPTGDAELKSIQIQLSVKEWSV
jgi:hypothetical protein